MGEKDEVNVQGMIDRKWRKEGEGNISLLTHPGELITELWSSHLLLHFFSPDWFHHCDYHRSSASIGFWFSMSTEDAAWSSAKDTGLSFGALDIAYCRHCSVSNCHTVDNEDRLDVGLSKWSWITIMVCMASMCALLASVTDACDSGHSKCFLKLWCAG